MTVEYFIQSQPQYAHERQALLALAQSMHRAFAASEKFYLLATNVSFWHAQIDALVLMPRAVVLIELKSCADPVYGRARGSWRVMPDGEKIHGGSYSNPYRQIVANREKLIKYLDRNRQRFLIGKRAREMANRWGQVSAAILFAPHLHPQSDIVVPPESRAWLGVIGLNEAADFLFSRFSPQIDLRPQELRLLATEALHCQPWADIERLLSSAANYGHLWLLGEDGRPAYAFPVVDGATIGRSRDNVLVVPRRYGRTSRHHARLRVMGDAVWLQDADSTHGTFVNGESVSSEPGRPLREGDRIALGDVSHPCTCRLRFEREMRPDAATEPTTGVHV